MYQPTWTHASGRVDFLAMATNPTALVQKLWNYCNILRDDGLSYGDYVEQLTFLLFLKMADEQSKPPFNKVSAIPSGKAWSSLLARDGDELETHYRHVLEELGKRQGLLGVIFRKAQNKIQDPAKLRRLIVDLIDKEQWSSLSADVKGDAYEGLLQKNAEDVKGGAGQYFTPRPLIAAMVDVVAPQPGQAICDPACGTGGFLLAAHDYLAKHHQLDRAQKKKLKSGTFFRHRAGGQRHAPLRDETLTSRHRRGVGRRFTGGHEGRPRGETWRIRDCPGQSAVRQEEQRDHRQRGGRVVQGIAGRGSAG
jgi:hypothetical protein